MTIDDLARRAGTATSTVRLYQTKGLLPPPQKQGRVGYYGQGHLARLRLIAQLQEEGFSLASIGQLVEAWEHGRSLEDLLGLEAQVASTWGAEEPLRFSPEELADRFPHGGLSPELIQRAFAMGLISLDGDRIVVQGPHFLEIGSRLAELGVPLDEILDEYEILDRQVDQVAERFTKVFERHLWEPFVSHGMPTDGVRDMTEKLQRLSTLAEAVVQAALRQALKRAASRFLAEQANELERAGVLETLRPLAAAAGLDLET